MSEQPGEGGAHTLLKESLAKTSVVVGGLGITYLLYFAAFAGTDVGDVWMFTFGALAALISITTMNTLSHAVTGRRAFEFGVKKNE